MALGYVPPSCYEWLHGNDTILCSRNHGESLTHCCEAASFWVVWISTWRYSNEAQVMRYSSDLEEWEPWVGSTAMMAEIDKRPATLIGDILYWLTKSNYIIAFDNLSRVLYYVECPWQTDDI